MKKEKRSHVHPPTNDKNSFDLFSFASTVMNRKRSLILLKNEEKLDNDVIYIVTNTKVFLSLSLAFPLSFDEKWNIVLVCSLSMSSLMN